MSGVFNPNDLSTSTRPGLYLRFLQLAELQLAKKGVGIVGIPLVSYGTAAAEAIFPIADIKDAETKFGAANIQSIKFALENAEKVIVFTLPTIDGTTVTEQIAYDKARVAFDTEKINVFVYDGIVSATEQDNAVRWVEQSKEEGRHFTVVLGCTDASEDLDPALGNARTALLNNEDVVNLINGVKIDGVSYTSAQFGPYIAGLIAACPMNKSITFAKLPVDDVTKRFTYTQTKDALAAGSLVLTQTGTAVRIEQGLVSNGGKLRKSLIRQGVSNDVKFAIEEEIIGQKSNDKNTQLFVVSMVKKYLETLESDGVLSGITVKVSETFPSVGDSLFLDIAYTEQDSLEKVFLSIAV